MNFFTLITIEVGIPMLDAMHELHRFYIQYLDQYIYIYFHTLYLYLCSGLPWCSDQIESWLS